MNRKIFFIEIILAFLIALFIALAFLAFWAKIFTGNFLNIWFGQEIAPAISFAISVALLFMVLKYHPKNKDRLFLIAGLSSYAVVWFMILAVEKYSFVFPQKVDFRLIYLIFPFFFTINILLILLGMETLYKKRL